MLENSYANEGSLGEGNVHTSQKSPDGTLKLCAFQCMIPICNATTATTEKAKFSAVTCHMSLVSQAAMNNPGYPRQQHSHRDHETQTLKGSMGDKRYASPELVWKLKSLAKVQGGQLKMQVLKKAPCDSGDKEV